MSSPDHTKLNAAAHGHTLEVKARAWQLSSTVIAGASHGENMVFSETLKNLYVPAQLSDDLHA